MKFKPRITRSVISIFGGIGVFFLSNKLFARAGECLPDPSNPGTQVCVDYAPSVWPLILPIISIILIYLIWSLVTNE
jgi:hypothetical protein